MATRAERIGRNSRQRKREQEQVAATPAGPPQGCGLRPASRPCPGHANAPARCRLREEDGIWRVGRMSKTTGLKPLLGSVMLAAAIYAAGAAS